MIYRHQHSAPSRLVHPAPPESSTTATMSGSAVRIQSSSSSSSPSNHRTLDQLEGGIVAEAAVADEFVARGGGVELVDTGLPWKLNRDDIGSCTASSQHIRNSKIAKSVDTCHVNFKLIQRSATN
jgi:hypothetical protein